MSVPGWSGTLSCLEEFGPASDWAQYPRSGYGSCELPCNRSGAPKSADTTK